MKMGVNKNKELRAPQREKSSKSALSCGSRASVRGREYCVAGKSAGAKSSGESQAALDDQAIFYGLFGFRRGGLCELYPVPCLYDFVRIVVQDEARLNDMLGEMPASFWKSQRQQIDSAGDAIVRGQRLHACQDRGGPLPGFLERVMGFGLDRVDMLSEFFKGLRRYHQGDRGRCCDSATNQGMHGVDVVGAQLLSDRCPDDVEDRACVQN